MVESADDLLLKIKQQIDDLVENDEKMQKFLAWIERKCSKVNIPYKPTTVCAFYIYLDLDCSLDLEFDREFDPDRSLDLD